MHESESVVTEEHIQSIAGELAAAANITLQQARRVLDLLHLDKLVENISTMKHLLADEQATNALGLSREDVALRRKVVTPSSFKLDNLRVGIKPRGVAGVHA